MVGNIFGECLSESALTFWCSSLLEDSIAIFLSVEFTFSYVHKFRNLVLYLSVQVLENS